MLGGVLRFRSAVAAGLVIVLGSGCATLEPRGKATTTTTGVESELPSVPPEVGQCRGLVTREIIGAPSDVRPPVPCDQPHGSETAFVTDLPPEVAGLSHREATALALDATGLRSVLEACDVAYEEYIGVTRILPDAVVEGNLIRAFFLPSFEDWAKGARWLRCDAVTEPVNGEVTRGITESLRGILDRDPLPPSWRSCYRDVSPPPRLSFGFLASCDQPHAAEVLLRFQVTDPKVEALAGDRTALEEHARSAFLQTCTERVAVQMGLSTEALARRGDVTVSSRALQLSRWAAEPRARQVQCLAFTSQLTIGTLEDLGERPLPRP